jgi:hypothetical protein
VVDASRRYHNIKELELEFQSCAQNVCSHEGCDPGCVSIPLVAILGYVVGDICEHLLEKIWSILVARSSGMRL